MPDTTGVRVERDGPVTVVTIDRPGRRNAVDPAAAAALAGAFREVERDPATSVAVLTGAGGTFCAGADLKAVAAGQPLRVAAEGATFGMLNRRFGVPLIDLGTIRLPRIVGHGRAMDLLLTGRVVGAAEALAMGLATIASGETAAGAASFAAGQGRHGAALPRNREPETR